MRWPTTKKPSTRDLLRAEHRLQVECRKRRWQGVLLVGLAAGLLGVLAWQQLDRHDRLAQRLSELESDNAALQLQLQESRLQLREAQATEAQLLRRIEEMSAQAKRLKTDLAFFRQQKKRQ